MYFIFYFLLDFLKDLKNAVAVLDLGGGSVQVTYIPTQSKESSKYITEHSIINSKVNLYRQRYMKNRNQSIVIVAN